MRPFLALALLLLAGCAQTSSALDALRTTSAADLAAAEAKAVAAGDDVGALCWKHLAPIPSAPGTQFGIASGIEDARIAAQAVAGPCSGILPVPLGLP